MKLLITAGPTREPIDAVRFVANRSSGRMGIALSQAGIDAGHAVTLLMGPAPIPGSLHDRCEVVRFSTTAQLEVLLAEHFPSCDTLIMAAAVADYRPIETTDKKLPRTKNELIIRLEPTPDLVAGITQHKRDDQQVIAYALEEAGELESRAGDKMRRKRVDAIIANALGTMENDVIDAVLLTAEGERQSPGPMSKMDFARWLMTKLI